MDCFRAANVAATVAVLAAHCSGSTALFAAAIPCGLTAPGAMCTSPLSSSSPPLCRLGPLPGSVAGQDR
jgi:hypothetical protein